MREVPCGLQDLPNLHPRLLWETIGLAAAAVLAGVAGQPPYPFVVHAENLPGFGGGDLMLAIDPGPVGDDSILRLRRTFDLPRQVELAAIAVAGLALAYTGGYEICDVALRGAPLTTWWAIFGLTSKLPAVPAERIWNSPGNRNGAGFRGYATKVVMSSLPSSKP